MPTAVTLEAYHVFREQLATNPALTDGWGHSEGGVAPAAARRGGVLTILERVGVGASNVAFHVIQGLRKRGIAQHTLGHGDPGSIGRLALHRRFDDAIAVPDPEASWVALRELTRRRIEECAPRAVILQREFPWAWILAELEAELPGLRTVVACNGGPLLFRVMDTPLEAELAAVLSRAALVTALSKFVRGHLLDRLGLDPAKVVAIRGGYDPALFHARGRVEDGGPMRVGYVGRLEPDKGPDRFIAALARARRAGVSVRATLVGDGAMRPALERSAREGVGEGAVRFAGSVDARAVGAFLRRCDVLVVPSRSEGLGIQTVEALACGVAVVASRVGGLQELLGESGAGYLVDSSEEMAARLAELAVDPDGRRKLAARGPAFLERERMDWDRVADRWTRELARRAAG